jgi:hypothetical protein
MKKQFFLLFLVLIVSHGGTLAQVTQRRGPALWSQNGQRTIASLPLAPHAAYRRSELQAMYAKFAKEIPSS